MPAVPDFLIVGAQKAGTTAAARNLALHPDIRVFGGVTEYGQREIEYFNQHWDREPAWYFDHFEGGAGIRGEKTAELLHRTICHERLWKTNTSFKLIVLLRSPIERAYSQWRMAALHKRDEPESFDAVVLRELGLLEDDAWRARFYSAIDAGVSVWREGYLLKGMYASQLTSLFECFPREQVWIGIAERVRADPADALGEMFEFLGVPRIQAPFQDHFVGRPAAPMSASTRAMLQAVYRQPIDDLCDLLELDIPEWRGGSDRCI